MPTESNKNSTGKKNNDSQEIQATTSDHIVPTTIGTWVLPIMNALDARGVDAKSLLAQAGIAPDCVNNAYNRVETQKMASLWRLASAATADECIGLEVIKYVKPSTFHALGLAHQASSSPRESLERSTRFTEIISTSVSANIEKSADETRVKIVEATSTPTMTDQSMDAFSALAYVALKDLTLQKSHILKRLELTRPAPTNATAHTEFFNCEVIFNAPYNQLTFYNDFLDTPIVSADPELARINEQILTQYLTKLKKDDIVSNAIQQITQLLAEGDPSQDKVAQGLGMSSRNLHRRLKERETSYKELLDDTRRQLALQLIKELRLPITNISLQLGFLDAGSFSRSFKRWTGQSPSEYRKGLTP